MPVAFGVEDGHLPRRHLDPLDAPTAVVVRLLPGEDEVADLVPREPAVVAHVHGAVRTDGRTVRSTAELGDHLDPTIGPDPAQRAPPDLHQDHAPVGHGDRPFREAEPRPRPA